MVNSTELITVALLASNGPVLFYLCHAVWYLQFLFVCLQ